jgi:hypothetical protein
MDTDCARCGRKVRPAENWLRAHLWASTAVFHGSCFIALMKTHGEAGAERATWQGDGHGPPATPADGTNANRGSEK